LHLAAVIGGKLELSPPKAWPGNSYHSRPAWTRQTVK